MRKLIITEEEKKQILQLHQFKKFLVESSEHTEKLYKSWANKKSGNPELALSLMNDFFNLQKKLPKKDFTQYETAEELKLDIDKLMSQPKKPEKEVDVIYKENDILVVAAKTWEAGCKYGSGTKWCTTSKDDSSYWKRHNNTGTEFIWIKKDIPSDNPLHKVSLHILDNNSYDWCNSINRCTKDSPYSLSKINIPNFDDIFELCLKYHQNKVEDKIKKRNEHAKSTKTSPEFVQMSNEIPQIFDYLSGDINEISEEVLRTYCYDNPSICDENWNDVFTDVYYMINNTLQDENIQERIYNNILTHMSDFMSEKIRNLDENVWRKELESQMFEMIIEFVESKCLDMLEDKYGR
jgi:hypothetical protein